MVIGKQIYIRISVKRGPALHIVEHKEQRQIDKHIILSY